ncbi:hypothetical protein MLD38_015367 [Melastoma candidum]|uniref:Uncharacterized protein n=1 Tax=Melastoma candidum TaxID=119954 RepID=A0ACB9RFY6_9MYRT|nr:hypothetical protein MLD38_015367 [Melastoma candidum]
MTDGSVPNTLVIANCDVVESRVAASEQIGQFNESARSAFVNRIRELPQNPDIVATHTDSPDVYIWDVESQPSKNAVFGATVSQPDLILTGHQENAEFALTMCPTEPFVLSGGKEKLVVLWSIQDHVASSAMNQATEKSAGSGGSLIKNTIGNGNDEAAKGSSKIGPRGTYSGHKDTVEDVAFCPFRSSAVFYDDSCLILWDARVGSSPIHKVEKAHDADLHCVDWNPHDGNLILAGSADNSIHMFDRRKLASDGAGLPVHKFEGHKAAVLCVQLSPDKSSVFGSSAEDGILNIWDYDKVMPSHFCRFNRIIPCGSTFVLCRLLHAPPGLFFQHAGHRDKVIDFHWNMYDPWTVVSVLDDCDSIGGGGTLQIWRMSDLIHRPEEEVLAELEKFKSHVLECSKS